MALSEVSETGIVTPTWGIWPTGGRSGVAFRIRSGSERLNTPFRRTLVYLLARTRGGLNRCRILKLLQQEGPLNANQIAGALGLHYTTVEHHIDRLLRDDVLVGNPRGDSYGARFFLTHQMEKNAEFLEEILPDLERSASNRAPHGGAATTLAVAVP